MTQMEAMTARLVEEALAQLRREAEQREMEADVAERLAELCRDTVAAARLARLRRARTC